MSKNAHHKITDKNANLPWSDVPFFLALARATSLTGAARSLKMNRSTVARRLDHLESTLAKPLFERQAGTFVLTSHGRKALAAATRAEEALLQFGQPTDHFTYGTLKVSISEHLQICYTDAFVEFSKEHPEIQLTILTSDRMVDLKRYEADIAIRMSRSAPSGLFHKKLGEVAFRVYRAKSDQGPIRRYIAAPREEVITPSLLALMPEAKIAMTVDGVLSARETIAAGGGVGVLSELLGKSDPRLEPITPPLNEIQDKSNSTGKDSDPFHVYLLCLPEQKSLYRVQTFFSFMSEKLK